MGGQVGDSGELIGSGFRFEVTDTQVDGAFTLHLGHLREGGLVLGKTVTARVDRGRRQAIRRAHSATHLLHHALRDTLGQHAQQQGSKVDGDWLRFDFTNPEAVSSEQLAVIEDRVNEKIVAGEPVAWANMPLAEARSQGAVMLFGEKYPDEVRVVSMGDYSKELCGGTHLENTGQIGLFKIVAEESVAAGTRRISALTGAAALEHVRRNERILSRAAAELKIPPEQLPDRVAGLAKEVRQLKKQRSAAPAAQTVGVDQLLAEAKAVGPAKVVVAEVPGADAQGLRGLIDQLRRKAAPVAALLVSKAEDGKVTLIAGLSRDLVEQGGDAVAWVRSAAKVVGGGGGGRPDMAQAGGKNAEKIPQALEAALEAIAGQLGG
jgi:alanyl-tRNA synthetase